MVPHPPSQPCSSAASGKACVGESNATTAAGWFVLGWPALGENPGVNGIIEMLLIVPRVMFAYGWYRQLLHRAT